MAHTAHTEHGAVEHGHHHVVPRKTLVVIFVALLFLTVLTVVTATQLDLGSFNLALALAIAGTKAFLVVAFFMALKYDSPVNRLVLTTGVIFVAIFMIFTMFDTLFRGDVGNVDPMSIRDEQRYEQEAAAQAAQTGGTAPAGDVQPGAGSRTHLGKAGSEFGVTACGGLDTYERRR
jgi:cytochrome c oxidase subunit 4